MRNPFCTGLFCPQIRWIHHFILREMNEPELLVLGYRLTSHGNESARIVDPEISADDARQ